MVSSSTSRASGLSKRNISAATGVSATVAPAINAAAGENHLSDGEIGEADRGHTLERLGHEDAPRVDAEHASREVHHPQRGRRLVNRDEVRRVERSEEERLPARRPGLDRRRVEGVRPPRRAEVPEIEECGDPEQPDQRRANPGRVLLTAAHERLRPADGHRAAGGRIPDREVAPAAAGSAGGGSSKNGREAMASLCRPLAHGDLSGSSEFAVSVWITGGGARRARRPHWRGSRPSRESKAPSSDARLRRR